MNRDRIFGCVGKFSLNRKYIFAEPLDVMSIMSKMIVVRAEFIFTGMDIEYTAYSDLFEFKAEGVEPPVYEVKIIDGEVVAERLPG